MSDLAERIDQAFALDDRKTHKGHAASRDTLLAIIAQHPEVFDDPSETHLRLIRGGAERCGNVGPFDKAIELFRKLAPMSGKAADYYRLSEVLTHGSDHIEESLRALQTAMTLEPGFYDTDANRETLRLGQARLDTRPSRNRIGRYPSNGDFQGDLESLIRDHIAVNLRGEAGFIRSNTSFFTMGSCFARNLGRALRGSGYACHHLEIAEHINTTFANRAFVDWLDGACDDPAIRARIEELLPSKWSKSDMLCVLESSSVFILTLGVASAFFDRETGAFVLPRPSALNSRVLAERYRFRTSTVAENVDNALHLIKFVRRIAPQIKIVVTVSPVPMLASFEFESAVQADCLSKSTMRLVAHEVVNNSGIDNILYWPSFEIFRWAGSNASDYYAADDGAAWHVSESKVAGTVHAFVKMFSERGQYD